MQIRGVEWNEMRHRGHGWREVCPGRTSCPYKIIVLGSNLALCPAGHLNRTGNCVCVCACVCVKWWGGHKSSKGLRLLDLTPVPLAVPTSRQRRMLSPPSVPSRRRTSVGQEDIHGAPLLLPHMSPSCRCQASDAFPWARAIACHLPHGHRNAVPGEVR